MKSLSSLIAALLCAAAAHAQTAAIEWWLDNDPAKAFDTQAKCDAAAKALNVSKAYQCPRVLRVTAKPVPVTWSLLGPENDAVRLSVAAGSSVRYGKGTAWIEKIITAASFVCSNSEFGGDPVPSVAKQCELKGGTASPPVVGSATVSWTAPTTNADGTPLTDLAGYRVLYGQTSGAYTQSVAASASPVTVQNLGAGAWFFVVKAIDTSGNESAASIEVSKTVQ